MPVWNGQVVLGGWLTLIPPWAPNITHVIPLNDRQGHETSIASETSCPCHPRLVPSYYDPLMGVWAKRVWHNAADGRGRRWRPGAQDTPDP